MCFFSGFGHRLIKNRTLVCLISLERCNSPAKYYCVVIFTQSSAAFCRAHGKWHIIIIDWPNSCGFWPYSNFFRQAFGVYSVSAIDVIFVKLSNDRGQTMAGILHCQRQPAQVDTRYLIRMLPGKPQDFWVCPVGLRPGRTATTCWGRSTHSSLGIPSGSPCWQALPGSGMSGMALWDCCCCRNHIPTEQYKFEI